MFQLSSAETARLRSQTVILDAQPIGIIEYKARNSLKNARGKHSKYLPYAFTEQGVAMLSSVLRSGRAVEVNVEIMRAFVALRLLLNEHAELADKLAKLERRYDSQFRVVFDAIRELMAPPPTPNKRIGFRKEDE